MFLAIIFLLVLCDLCRFWNFLLQALIYYYLSYCDKLLTSFPATRVGPVQSILHTVIFLKTSILFCIINYIHKNPSMKLHSLNSKNKTPPPYQFPSFLFLNFCFLAPPKSSHYDTPHSQAFTQKTCDSLPPIPPMSEVWLCSRLAFHLASLGEPAVTPQPVWDAHFVPHITPCTYLC